MLVAYYEGRNVLAIDSYHGNDATYCYCRALVVSHTDRPRICDPNIFHHLCIAATVLLITLASSSR